MKSRDSARRGGRSLMFNDLNSFLYAHKAKDEDKKKHTHTRIGDKLLDIHGGTFYIPPEEMPTFYQLYYDKVFVKKHKEYLTEKQVAFREDGEQVCGPMAVDFDFRYEKEVTERVHTKEHIQDMVCEYLEVLKECFDFVGNGCGLSFPIYVFEKPTMNVEECKDGIHMIIGLQVDHTMQQIIRERMKVRLADTWSDLPLKNEWDTVLDESITRGTNNWNMYGSRKPGKDAYVWTHHYMISMDPMDYEFMMDEKVVPAGGVPSREMLSHLSVQYGGWSALPRNTRIEKEYMSLKEQKPKQKKKGVKRRSMLDLAAETAAETEEAADMKLEDIVDAETLDCAVKCMLKQFDLREYDVKETHYYVQALPPSYYEPGSHTQNRLVAFALKHTDERLFLSWVQLRSKASDFDYGSIMALYDEWRSMPSENTAGRYVTRRSILYWCKKENPEEYARIRKDTIDYFIERSIQSCTEYDIAVVLSKMYKESFVCVSYAEKGVWYRFRDHHWVKDKGLRIRNAVSTELFDLYEAKFTEVSATLFDVPSDDEKKHKIIKDKIEAICVVKNKCKKTADKNNILREAAEILFDAEFIPKVDSNKYLLCFTNGVVDFTPRNGGNSNSNNNNNTPVFRDGYPEDYITKCTNIPYVDVDDFTADQVKELKDLIEQLFPIPDLNRYMWDHLASCLIGANKNQLFNVYYGSGSNGKSILAKLMSGVLGDYKGLIPITMVTAERNKVGGTSSEIIQLKGVRYAVMQEPTKGMKLNEGVMKELTGGDPIQARGLYTESETFDLQANIVVCTNNLFDIESNDDGTWRRIRKVEFPAKFVTADKLEEARELYKEETKYIYLQDKSLEDRIPQLAVVFASMLVKRAFQTGGIVEDCETVMKASNSYRNSQDHLSAFIKDRIAKTGLVGDRVGKRSLYEEFKVWFAQEQGGGRKVPKGEELYEAMTKRFGPPNKGGGWLGVVIVHPEPDQAASSSPDANVAV